MKTTKQDFEMFQAYCRKWIDKLGVKDWSIHFDHSETDNAYAQTNWRTSGRVATIVLAKDWDKLRQITDTELDRLALHEVLHILLAPLISEAEYRYSTQDAIDAAEHSIIRQLENIIV